MRYGLYDARGYDYPVERRYDTLWRSGIAPGGDFIEPTQRAGATAKALRGLSLLSVSDVLHYPYGEPPRQPGLRLVYSGPDARVYRNERAVPRTFLVPRQRVVASDDAALAAITHPRFDPRRVAITEQRVPALPRRGPPRWSRPGTARLVSYAPEHVVAAASAEARSMLVLTDVYLPGWKATVDGRPAAIHRVDYLLRGVVVPAGSHRVEFRYEPLSWRIGWIVSTIALIALAALALVGWRRRSRPIPPGP
jgi:hypothetical protein